MSDGVNQTCWCCLRPGPVDWGEQVMSKAMEDIFVGRVKPGEVYWVARWATAGMRHADIERVAVALEEGGWARNQGRRLIQILENDSDTAGDPEERELQQ